MTNRLRLLSLLLLLTCCKTHAQSTEQLKQKIQQLVASKHAVVGVHISGNNGRDTLSLNGGMQFPMQSVFKFHIGLMMMSEIDKGNFSLEQKINIGREDLLPGLYSPIREKYPKGARLPLSKILEYTVAESDNVGCDLLLKLLGRPAAVENYFIANGFMDVSIKINEETMQNNWDMQFQNWTTPKAATDVLTAFYYNSKKLLSPKSHAFIWKLMKQTTTGKDRLKGKLPKGTVVAHKTGTSGTNKEGISAAVNDIGIVLLPNNRHFFISVFVTNSREDQATNEKMIAEIAKLAWDHFIKRAN
jgi:beta-lactamase class A